MEAKLSLVLFSNNPKIASPALETVASNATKELFLVGGTGAGVF